MSKNEQLGPSAAERAAWERYEQAHYKALRALEAWRAANNDFENWLAAGLDAEDTPLVTNDPRRNPFDDPAKE
jgi:hypothetical protein